MSLTALFGGTFNPLHIGHCEILAALENRPEIGEIWIMPTRIPPHKVFDKVADDSVRIEMFRMAAKHYKKAQVSLIEFERTGKSYTFDTVKLLKQKYPERDFVFVCGGDRIVSCVCAGKNREAFHGSFGAYCGKSCSGIADGDRMA